jgi:hypothetical protein
MVIPFVRLGLRRGGFAWALLILRAACSPLAGFPSPHRCTDGRVGDEGPARADRIAVFRKEVALLQARPGDRVGIEADDLAAWPSRLDYVMLALRAAGHG